MECKSKKPKPPNKTIDTVAQEKANSRIATIHTARKVKLEEL